MTKKYDMHVHTNLSDGYKSPEEVISIARDSELEGIAITDHDRIFEFKEAQRLSKKNKIEVISAGEIGADIKLELGKLTKEARIYVELLVYFFKGFDSRNLNSICIENKNKRIDRMIDMIYNVNKKFGCDITLKEVHKNAEGAPLSKHHLANIMLSKRIGGMKSNAEIYDVILDRFAENSCYVNKNGENIKILLSEIRKAGGVVSLAHPGLISAAEAEIDDKYIYPYIKPYLRGGMISAIECNYPYYNPNRKRQRHGLKKRDLEHKIDFWTRIAEKHNLIKTGGTDSHQRQDDFSIGTYFTDENQFNLLKAKAKDLRKKYRKILVVDDEKAIRNLFKEYFEEKGYTIDLADDAASAIRKIRKKQYAVIFSDILMRGIKHLNEGGKDILEFVKEQKKDIPVVMDYLTKPFDFSKFQEIVEKYI